MTGELQDTTIEGRRGWTVEEELATLQDARATSAAISEVGRRHGIALGYFYVQKARWHLQRGAGTMIIQL